MDANSTEFQDYLTLSSVLTGFSEYRLRGTGQAESYFLAMLQVVGEHVVAELAQAFRAVQQTAGEDETAKDKLLRAQILSHEKLGPIARNLIKMWYVGTWYQLPFDWHEKYGGSENDATFVVSAAAYTEGLLWPTIDANPSGAKGPGYGTWGDPPNISYT